MIHGGAACQGRAGVIAPGCHSCAGFRGCQPGQRRGALAVRHRSALADVQPADVDPSKSCLWVLRVCRLLRHCHR